MNMKVGLNTKILPQSEGLIGLKMNTSIESAHDLKLNHKASQTITQAISFIYHK